MPDPMTTPTWKAVANREDALLYRRTAERAFAAAELVRDAKRRAPTKGEAPGGARLLRRQALVWHLWRQNTAGGEPKVGDVVQDWTGARWTVRAVDVESYEDRYHLFTLKEQ
jgi:hypothetical protein